MRVDVGADTLRAYRPDSGWSMTVGLADVVRADSYPGESGLRDVRIELAPGVEPSPIVVSMRAPDAESLVDEIRRAASRPR